MGTKGETPPDSTHHVTAEADEQTFFQRWSRRKLDVERASQSTAETPIESADGSADPDAGPEQDTPLTDADMPPLETLDQNSDFSLFMSAGVGEVLRRKALRKLFHGPKFNLCDGLCDYDDDYTGLSPLGDIVTAEMRRGQERLLEKAKEKTTQWIDNQARGPSSATNKPAAEQTEGDSINPASDRDRKTDTDG